MVDQLTVALRGVGLILNGTKTVAMTSNPRGRDVTVGCQKVRVVDRCVYLGQEVTLDNSRFGGEIGRRIRAANFSFSRYRSLFASRTCPMFIKKRLFEGAILPDLTYGSETWALTRRLENRIAVAQRRWERVMLGVSLLDRRRNDWVRDKAGLRDAVRICRERKWSWASRVAGMESCRWTRAVLEWHPRGPTRKKGRPEVRWSDTFVKAIGPGFLTLAEDKKEWKRIMALQIQ